MGHNITQQLNRIPYYFYLVRLDSPFWVINVSALILVLIWIHECPIVAPCFLLTGLHGEVYWGLYSFEIDHKLLVCISFWEFDLFFSELSVGFLDVRELVFVHHESVCPDLDHSEKFVFDCLPIAFLIEHLLEEVRFPASLYKPLTISNYCSLPVSEV